jgi:hypothetical protein
MSACVCVRKETSVNGLTEATVAKPGLLLPVKFSCRSKQCGYSRVCSCQMSQQVCDIRPFTA